MSIGDILIGVPQGSILGPFVFSVLITARTNFPSVDCFTVSSLLSVPDSTSEDVKKLKVCIELNGLRLNKPRLPGELRQWLPPGHRPAEGDKKFRMDVPAVSGRSEVGGGWCDRMFWKRDDQRGKGNQLVVGFFLIFHVVSCLFYIVASLHDTTRLGS